MPIGGGGLIAGIAVYVKYLHPHVKIIGVEPEDAAAMYESLRAGRRVTLDRVGIFADGVAVKRVGEETFNLCREHVDEVLLVDTDEICAAIQDVFEDTRSIVEPAGALAVAGVKKWVERERWQNKRVVAVNSGANMNFDRLRHVAERADLGGEREALLAVEIPEEPGSFLRFCETLGKRSVTEFNYRYEAGAPRRSSSASGSRRAVRSGTPWWRRCAPRGYSVNDMTDNEMAKLHVRYMVGGPARGIQNEAALSLRVSGAAGRAHALPAGRRLTLEHQPVPLSQSRLGLRARDGRHPGAARPSVRISWTICGAALRLHGRDGEPGVQDLPGRVEPTSRSERNGVSVVHAFARLDAGEHRHHQPDDEERGGEQEADEHEHEQRAHDEADAAR